MDQKYRRKNPPRFPLLPLAPEGHFAALAVIPVYQEQERLAITLRTLADAQRAVAAPCAVLLVINHPQNAPQSALAENRAVLTALTRQDPALLGGWRPGQDCFWIDADPEPLADGVGEARKIGLDAALDRVAPECGILCSLDADTRVEPNYFQALLTAMTAHPEWAGALLPFAHDWPEAPAERQAAVTYELWMRHYALLLRRAGSPYGFWSLGSAFAVRPEAYCKAGGMRKRSGGEDFYFLQALRKTGPLGIVRDTTVHPSGRVSDRVPFGTGPRVRELASGSAAGFYAEALQEELQKVFQTVQKADQEALADLFQRLPEGMVRTYFEQEHFSEAWEKIIANQPPTRPARLRAFHVWFDGFRQLRFCHWAETQDPVRFARTAVLPGSDSAADEARLERLRQEDRLALLPGWEN